MSTTIVLITGGNTGVGYATAQALLEAQEKKYAILITSRTLEKALEAAKTLNATVDGEPVVGFQADIDDDESVKKLHEEVTGKYGRVDVLVNNAGVNNDLYLLQGKMTPREAWNGSYNTNVTSTHLFTQTFMNLLFKSPSPRIIFISSTVGSIAAQTNSNIPINKTPEAGWPKTPAFNIMSYRSSKTGMNMMIREWKRILKNDEQFKVYCVSPGLLATNLAGAGAEQMAAMGAMDPIIGGRHIRKVIEGERDDDIDALINVEGTAPW